MAKTTLLALVCVALTCGQQAMGQIGEIQSGPNGTKYVIKCRADVAFCIDNSGSIRDTNQGGVDNWDLMVKFIQALVKQINVGPDGTHVGLVDFGNRAHIAFDLNGNQTEDKVVEAVGALKYRGENTNTTGGLYWCREILSEKQYGARPDVPKVIILVTDGVPTYDSDKLPAEVARIKNYPMRIVSVGITNLINETLLKEIASTPRDYVYGGDFRGLDQAKNTVINNETCLPVMLTTPAPPTTTPLPTTTPIPAPEALEMSCGPKPDIAFIIDTTGCDSSSNVTLLKEYLVSLIYMIDFEAQPVHAGFLTLIDNGEPLVNLNHYTDRLELVANSRTLMYAAGNFGDSNATDTSKAPETTVEPLTQETPVGTQEIQTGGMPNNPQPAQTQGMPNNPQPAQTQGMPNNPQPAQTQGMPNNPQPAQTQGMPNNPQEAQTKGMPVGPQEAMTMGMPVGPQEAQTQVIPNNPNVPNNPNGPNGPLGPNPPIHITRQP